MKLLKRLRALLPSKLPQGMSEFDAWADDILDIYNLPNNDSTKFALATAIMHIGATECYKPKEYFGRTLLKGAATQIAYAKMNEMKERQAVRAKEEAEAAARKAETDKQVAEVTAAINNEQ